MRVCVDTSVLIDIRECVKERISIKLHEQSQTSDVADTGLAEGIIPFQQEPAIFQALLRATSMLVNPNPGAFPQFLPLTKNSQGNAWP